MKRSAICLIFLTAILFIDDQQTTELYVTSPKTEWIVNEAGRLVVRIEVRDGTLEKGARLACSIPGSWVVHAFRSYERDGKTYPYQSYAQLTKDLAEYLAVDPLQSRTEWNLEIVERDADGSYHRFAREAVFTLVAGSLEKGERIEVHYGSDAKPIHASFLAESVPLPIRVNSGNGRWSAVEPTLRLTTASRPASRLLVTLPSQGVTEEPVRLHVAARDAFGNPAPLPADLRLRPLGSKVRQIPRITGGQTFEEVILHFPEEGFYTVEVGNEALGFMRSNPVLIAREEPRWKLYWGDLHSHSGMSKDGVGSRSFKFARDDSNLDFFASAEHSTGDREDAGVTDEEWIEIQRAVRSFYEPGRFVTLLGYECSLSHPYGHHNVYFASDEAPIYRKHEVKTLRELWRRLASHRAFTVPHHLGIVFGTSGEGASVVWSEDHPLRPLLEIYSGHGQSELYDPSHPLSYDQMIFDQRWKEWFPRHAPSTPAKYRSMVSPHSHKGAHYARDAWAAGFELGTIASSDDHTARPGQASKGLAAVWAEGLDRESIFQGLRNKRTYATSGQRIYLDFRVNGRFPGSRVTATDPPQIDLKVYGTRDLESVELFKLEAGTAKYEVIRHWLPGRPDLDESLRDARFQNPCMYYVRVRQKGLIEGRPAFAWSTPIWVDPASVR